MFKAIINKLFKKSEIWEVVASDGPGDNVPVA